MEMFGPGYRVLFPNCVFITAPKSDIQRSFFLLPPSHEILIPVILNIYVQVYLHFIYEERSQWKIKND